MGRSALCLCLLGGGLDTLAADYDITSYGAIANDGIDDLAAIQSAISAASPGDRVIIPTGTFTIQSAIDPTAGISIIGAGRDSSTIEYRGTTNADGMIRLEGVGNNNIELSGFTLDGLNSTYAQQGILASDTSGHQIHGVRVQNLVGSSFGPAGIYFSFDADNSVIKNNEFLNIGVADAYGSGIRLDHGSEGNSIIGNTIQNTGRGGIFLANGSTDSVIKGNTVTGSGLTTAGLGIEVWGGSHRAVIEDNTVDHWLSVDRSNHVAVRNNTVMATDGSVAFIGIEVAGGSDVIIKGNTVGAGNQIGLSMSNDTAKERIYIANNTFSDSETWGAQLQDDGGEIRQVYLYSNTFERADSDPPNSYEPAGVGFRFNATDVGAGIRQIVLDSNHFVNNDDAGIQTNRETGGTLDQISFIGNTISDNGSDAFIDLIAFDNLEWDAFNVVSNNAADNQPTANANTPGFQANGKPAVDIVAPATVDVGQAVSFAFLYADDGDTLPAQVLWDFSEGLPITDLAPNHTFTEVGTYEVALLAWDAEGRAAHDVLSIQVVPSPSSGASLLLLLTASLRRRKRSA